MNVASEHCHGDDRTEIYGLLLYICLGSTRLHELQGVLNTT